MKLLNQKKSINPLFMKSGLGGCEGFAWGEKLPRRWRVRPKVSGGGAPRSVSEGEDKLSGG
jgi:hypothetical protein